MPTYGFTPRKQRTRQHIIADQSINHFEKFVLDAGHVALRHGSDYGYDLSVTTFDEHGYIEPDQFSLQFKASEVLKRSGADFVFEIDVRDYNLWMQEDAPVFLILYDALRRRAYWLHVQEYFRAGSSGGPKKGAKTIRARVPERQRVNRRAIAMMRERKQATLQGDVIPWPSK